MHYKKTILLVLVNNYFTSYNFWNFIVFQNNNNKYLKCSPNFYIIILITRLNIKISKLFLRYL